MFASGSYAGSCASLFFGSLVCFLVVVVASVCRGKKSVFSRLLGVHTVAHPKKKQLVFVSPSMTVASRLLFKTKFSPSHRESGLMARYPSFLLAVSLRGDGYLLPAPRARRAAFKASALASAAGTASPPGLERLLSATRGRWSGLLLCNSALMAVAIADTQLLDNLWRNATKSSEGPCGRWTR